jgi:hypothetical protein
MFVCQEANAASLFDTLADKTSSFAKGLRNIAYVISGFGIIMFTFLAISGKINFKHLGYISISLFILSAMGAFIDYITKDSEAPSSLSSEFGDTYKNAGYGQLCQSNLCSGSDK